MKKNKLTKLLITFLIIVLVGSNLVYAVSAQTVPPSPPPDAPEPPSPPSAPEDPPEPSDAPTPPPNPSAPPSMPSPPPAPSPDSQPSPIPSPISSPDLGSDTRDTSDADMDASGDEVIDSSLGETTGDQHEDSGSGDATIDTGDADSSAIVVNNANSNLGGQTSTGSAEDIVVENSNNGSNSTNAGDVNTQNDSSTIQTNGAIVDNDLDLASVSGENSSSYNTGVDSSVKTGDANTTAAVINGVNTNIDGVSVIEFNVNDNHNGDIILEMPEGDGCSATVCGGNGNLSATNEGNGANSTNDASIADSTTDNTFQNNSADVVNDLVLVADSGNNQADYNTKGDSSVDTGDANVVATVGNFVNNNIAGAGEVLVAVVNIFGDLIGNIILPESTLTAQSGTSATNSSNGSGSTNTASINDTNTTNTTQVNMADINNNIDAVANTGDNSASYNTGGFSQIETGDASIDINTLNIANSNIVGDDTWWLVFVNDTSGNWIGYIVGAPDGANMAGGAGTEFIMNPDGTVIAQNVGNGAGSDNNASIDSSQNTQTTQVNQASITNNLTLEANTGGNSTSYNTGGSNSIETGDASVMANIINFVNNNFVGGNVVVSIVNVFGSWLGSFVPPGEEAPQLAATGGVELTSGSHDSSTNNDNTNTESHSHSSTNQSSDSSTGDENLATSVMGTAASIADLLNMFSGRDSEIGQKNAAGQVIEDDTIIVPGTVKTASARSEIPFWFWLIFVTAVILVFIKKTYKLAQKKIQPAY